VTKKIKQVKKSPSLRTLQELGQEATSKKAHAFAEHLPNVFQPHPSENQPEEEEEIIQLLETPYKLEPPINRLKDLKFKKSSTA
jgi:hypothetical protein